MKIMNAEYLLSGYVPMDGLNQDTPIILSVEEFDTPLSIYGYRVVLERERIHNLIFFFRLKNNGRGVFGSEYIRPLALTHGIWSLTWTAVHIR